MQPLAAIATAGRRLWCAGLKRAKHHRDIIRRFGRFPHRNPILSRAMRSQEQRFLDEGGLQVSASATKGQPGIAAPKG
ncbi:DUF924 family protein [Mesorhizobium neociceri]|uniref:DUF924 family protein n=1 Tax=Mesorhizobium neociceri TaxID=1307853 RepID=UPI0038B2819D